MNNDELLEKKYKRFDTLEQGQAQTNNTVAQIKTVVETLEAGQKDIREEMATKADMQDLDAKLVKKVNQHDKRLDALEEAEGISNPYKH